MKLKHNGCSIFLATFILCVVDSRGIAGNVKLVAMNGNQYWFSTSSPYAPTLNFHLAYQYCRTLGLQLLVLETTEEVETISAYLNKDPNPMSHSKYWTSGNKLGADSWIWMSSGDQLNSSFADYWLKNGVSTATTENPRSCLSMKPPISPMTKRAIFTAEECNKSFPFICEQVRCLYYNYPVMMFPDPSELRTDIEEGTAASAQESESRTSVNFSTSEKIRKQNYITTGSERHKKTSSSFSDIATAESGRLDSTQIQRRITLRPVMTNYPLPPTSFSKGKHFNNATSKRSFAKTISTEETKEPSNSSGSAESIKIHSIFNKKLSSRKAHKSSPTITKSSNENILNNKPYTQLEIVTSKSASVNGEVVKDTREEQGEESPEMLFHRYGTGSNPNEDDHIFGSGYVSTLSPSIVFAEDDVEYTTIPTGNGIRHPDNLSNEEKIIEGAKSEIKYSNWGRKPSSSAIIIADTESGSDKMGLGPRLKLRLQNFN